MNFLKNNLVSRSLDNANIAAIAEAFNEIIHIDDGKMIVENVKAARGALALLLDRYERDLHLTSTPESTMQFNRLVSTIQNEASTSTALFSAKCLFILCHGNKQLEKEIVRLDARQQGKEKLSAEEVTIEIRKLEHGPEDIWAIKAQSLVSDYLTRKGVAQYELNWGE